MFRSNMLDRNSPNLRLFDNFLRKHLAEWFADGFMDLQQITWGTTSAGFIEKVLLFKLCYYFKCEHKAFHQQYLF